MKNLGVARTSIDGGSYSVGTVAGRIVTSTVENCYSSGKVSSTEIHVGGVIGYSSDSTIKKYYSSSIVSGASYVGGVAGSVNGTMKNCYSTAIVNSTDSGKGYKVNVGGVAGNVGYYGTMRNYVALNPLVSGNSEVGRVAGANNSGASGVGILNNYAYSGMTVLINGSAKGITSNLAGIDGGSKTAALASNGASIEKCFVTGLVSGGQFAGGIAGFVKRTEFGSGVSIENCYSDVIVTSTYDLGSSGGIAGGIEYGDIKNCYTTGSIIGFQDAGGISGSVGSKSIISNCAALNEKITAPTGIGRMGVRSGFTNENAFSNNIAFNGMTVKGTTISDGSEDNENGASLSSATLFDDNFWIGSGEWAEGSTWGNSDIWTVEGGKLPIFTGLAGQSGVPDLYLLNLFTDKLSIFLMSWGRGY